MVFFMFFHFFLWFLARHRLHFAQSLDVTSCPAARHRDAADRLERQLMEGKLPDYYEAKSMAWKA